MPPITYRKALPADAPTIVEFQLAMARETEDLELSQTVCTRGVEAVFADASLGQYFIAEIDEEIAASLLITYEWSDWRNGVVWWIQSVYVRPAARGQGVYAGLYAHIKQLVENDPGIRGLRLYVDKSNLRAQAVYAKLGMNGEHYQVFEWMK